MALLEMYKELGYSIEYRRSRHLPLIYVWLNDEEGKINNA